MVTFLSEFYSGVSNQNVLHMRYADSLVIWTFMSHGGSDTLIVFTHVIAENRIGSLQFSTVSCKFIPPMSMPSYPALNQTVIRSNRCRYHYTKYMDRNVTTAHQSNTININEIGPNVNFNYLSMLCCSAVLEVLQWMSARNPFLSWFTYPVSKPPNALFHWMVQP